MLGNLIAEAKLSVEDEFKSAKYSCSSSSSSSSEEKVQDSSVSKAEEKGNIPLSTVTSLMASATLEEDENHLLGAMSLYLAQLFDLDSDDEADAEAVQNFRRLRRFEDRAVAAFDPGQVRPDGDFEFSFEQEKLHREYCDLFEQLTENFLLNECGGCTSERFYKEVKKAMQSVEKAESKSDAGQEEEARLEAFAAAFGLKLWHEPSEKERAEEVLKTIMSVCDFEEWAKNMMDLAKRNKEIASDMGF